MIVGTLTLIFIGSIGFFFHFLLAAEFVDAAKMLVTSGGIFALLAACLSVRRASRRAGY